MTTNIESLPEECVSMILSFTSPADASRFSVLSSSLRSSSLSDMLWFSFLPSHFNDVVSRAVTPIHFSSFRHLFYSLSRPTLLDGGTKCFQLDKQSGQISYLLSAKELYIAWGDIPMYWSWIPMPDSRFPVVAHLRTTNWLEIKGKIKTGILTPNTWYTVYLIMKVSHRAYGLDCGPSQVSVQVGDNVKNEGTAYLCEKDDQKQKMENLFYGNRRDTNHEGHRVPFKREDGWMEIEMGEFFSDHRDQEVNMSLMEVSYQLKGGLIIEGIQIRPKHVSSH